MRNLENIDLDTLDHVTGGCGGGQAQAQQQPPPVEQHQGNATTLVGFPVRADSSTRTMSDYATPSIIALGGYTPADDTDTSTVQSQTSGDDDVQSGHGRFGMGFGHASSASADADADADVDVDQDAAAATSYGAWDQVAGSFGHAVGYTGYDDGSTATTNNTTAATDDSPYMVAQNTGFTYATQSSAALDDDPADAPAPGEETQTMVCGTMPGPGIMAGGCYGDDGVDGQDGADGADGATDAAADTTMLDNRTMLGSFHNVVDRGASTSMMYGGQIEAAAPAAGTESMGYSIDTDLGGFGHLQVANGDVNVDVDTPLGNVSLGYNNGQLGASLNRG